jgi:hypothetical protein
LIKKYRNLILNKTILFLKKFLKKEYELIFENNTVNNYVRFIFYRLYLNLIIFYKKNDFWKHWDFFKEIFIIKSYININEKILICGIGRDFSNILFLDRIGYKNLYCFDLKQINYKTKKKIHNTNIKFSVQDLYNLKYNFKFNYISLTSVIEHMDKYDELFSNLSNVSELGCKLFITTDFWPDKILTKGLYPYGVNMPEMKVFSKEEVLELVTIANKNNFMLVNDKINFDVTKKYIHWKRMNIKYTFISLLFKKTTQVNF